jgi:hypothetical protein
LSCAVAPRPNASAPNPPAMAPRRVISFPIA